jgi:hypothetical protein
MITPDSKISSHRVRIRLIPRLDDLFRATFERACVAALIDGADIDTPEAARLVEDHLRSHGYPDAEVQLFRSVEDYRRRTSNWVVRRERAQGLAPHASNHRGSVKGGQ